MTINKWIANICLIGCLGSVNSAEVNVQLLMASDDVLGGAAVVLKSLNGATEPSENVVAIMDQVDRQFNPRILVVPKGTPVAFPNSDSIKHHVYSFSPAKVFEIELYKGSENDPVTFNKGGVVELGCNVHDWMLGYIYVSESPYYAQLDENNNAVIDVPDGDYEVSIWHPRMQEADAQRSKRITVSGETNVEISLNESLLPDPFAEDDDIFDDFDIYE